MENSKRALVRVRGRGVMTRVRKGTASEHNGVVLESPDGERLLLVRLGGNPFDDPETRKLEGREIEVEGYRVGNELRYVSVHDVA